MTTHAIDALRLVGGHPALDFANTLGQQLDGAPNEHLVDYAALLAWSRRVGLSTARETTRLGRAAVAQPAEASRILTRARALRSAIFALFAARAGGRSAPHDALARLNRELADALAHSALAPADGGFDWRWTGDPAALERVLWPLARAAADLLAAPELAAVRECAGAECHWLFLDLSKNRRRRWCAMELCGNRAKIRRFRAGA